MLLLWSASPLGDRDHTHGRTWSRLCSCTDSVRVHADRRETEVVENGATCGASRTSRRTDARACSLTPITRTGPERVGRIDGVAEILTTGDEHRHALNLLAAKYKQYESMPLGEAPIIRIHVEHVSQWHGGPR